MENTINSQDIIATTVMNDGNRYYILKDGSIYKENKENKENKQNKQIVKVIDKGMISAVLYKFRPGETDVVL